MVVTYIPEITTRLILRNRQGQYESRVVRAGTRTGIPEGIEIIAEIPADPEYGNEEA